MDSILIQYSRPTSTTKQDVHISLLDAEPARRLYQMWKQITADSGGLQFAGKFKEIQVEMFAERAKIAKILSSAVLDEKSTMYLGEIVTNTINYWNSHQYIKQIINPKFEEDKKQLTLLVEGLYKLVPTIGNQCMCKKWNPIMEMIAQVIVTAEEQEEQMPDLIEISEGQN